MTSQKVARFEERKTAILDAATDLLNQHGAQGFRRADVAARLGYDTSTISYYFRRKEDLIAACVNRTTDWFHETAANAAKEADPVARTRFFIRENFNPLEHQRGPARSSLAVLSDLTVLSEETRAHMDQQIAETYQAVADFYKSENDSVETQIRNGVIANTVLSGSFWMPAWEPEIHVSDLDRAIDRLTTTFATGLLTPEAKSDQTEPLSLEEAEPSNQKEQFLRAATRLINTKGYLGARVDLISAELGVSTGSFYHHLKTKDEVVVAAFERTFSIIETAFTKSKAETAGATLYNIVWNLAAHQLMAGIPLLGLSSYQALPETLRYEVLHRARQLTHHISGLLADGMAEGTVRPTDPFIAANMIFAGLQGLSAVRFWLPEEARPIAVNAYRDLLQKGIVG